MVRALLLVSLLAVTTVSAMEPVQVDQVRFAQAELVVVSPEGEHRYGPEDLEALGTYAITTETPWRDTAATFIGARLKDVLSASGLEEKQAIRVVAENDYAVTIGREVWVNHDLLIATRVNGLGHTRRARGPLQFVFNMREDAATGKDQFQQNWVWMAARIEAVE